MKHLVVLSVLTVALSVQGFSQDKGFGAGVLLGEPTGLSAKAWTSHRNAVDFGVAYSFRSKGYLHLHADYLWHFLNVIESTERIPLFVGVGGRLAVGRGSGIVGVRIPVGIAFWLRSAPIEFFLEVAPIVDLAPATGASANGGVGARYYFN